MLHYRGVSFTLQDNFGCTPLHYACLQCSLPLIEFILGKYLCLRRYGACAILSRLSFAYVHQSCGYCFNVYAT